MEKNIVKSKVFAKAFYVLVLLILIIRAKYSFCQSDESFYAALIHRLWIGEGLITHEWHPVQFYTPLLLPFYYIFRWIVPSGDGVIYFWRILYVLFAGYTGYVFIQRMQQIGYSTFISSIGGLFCLLYSRANIQGMSYYNLCLLFVVLSILSMQRCYSSKAKNTSYYTQAFSAGVFFSCAVLCNPYLSFFVILFVLYLIVRKENKSIGTWVLFGIILSALVYFALLFSRSSIHDIITCIPNIFNDPQHTADWLTRYHTLISQWHSIGGTHWNIFFPCLMTLLILICKKLNRPICSIIWSVYSVIALFLLFHTEKLAINSIANAIFVPMAFIFFPCTIYELTERHYSFALILYFIGFALCAAFFMASNTYLDAMTSGFCLSSIAGLFLFEDILNGYNTHTTHTQMRISFLNKAVLLILCTSVLITTSLQRVIGVYRDAPLSQLNTSIDHGPAKGLMTTALHEEVYSNIYNTIQDIYDERPDEQVIFLKWLPWAYAVTDWNYATVSPWNINTNDPRLITYYSLHPEKRPTLVFIMANTVASCEKSPYNNHGALSSPNKVSKKGWLYQQIQSYGTLIEKTEYTSVYSIDWPN